MDTINSEATTSGEATTGSGDPREQWRMQLQPESRQRIVTKIMDTLERHLSLPVQGQEGLIALRSSAVRFEEKMYAIATSQSDYLRRISHKMLLIESRYQTLCVDAKPVYIGAKRKGVMAGAPCLQ